MYVEDVKDGKRTYRHIFIITFLIWYHLNIMLSMSKMSKMSKIDQIHLRAVMLCMSKMSKMGKEHTQTFWFITSLILNGISIQKKVLENCDLGLSSHTIKYCVYQSMLEMSEVDQLHLRAVMLFMSEMSEIVIIFNIHIYL